MKDVIVNGTTYSGISSVLLQLANGDGNAFFQDIDEIAAAPGILEIASGTFTVTSALGGASTSLQQDFTVEHGMSAKPDVVFFVPKYWYDTQDSQIINSMINTRSSYWVGLGRRSVEQGTNHFSGGAAANGSVEYVNDTVMHPPGTNYGKYLPTYIDDKGNEGQQIYQWVAIRFAEE